MTMFPAVGYVPALPSSPERLPLSSALQIDTRASNANDPLAGMFLDLCKARFSMMVAQARGQTIHPYHLSDAQIELCRQTFGEPFEAMLAQNGNAWDIEGLGWLTTMVSGAMKPPTGETWSGVVPGRSALYPVETIGTPRDGASVSRTGSPLFDAIAAGKPLVVRPYV